MLRINLSSTTLTQSLIHSGIWLAIALPFQNFLEVPIGCGFGVLLCEPARIICLEFPPGRQSRLLVAPTGVLAVLE
jgi:hypothetical protein